MAWRCRAICEPRSSRVQSLALPISSVGSVDLVMIAVTMLERQVPPWSIVVVPCTTLVLLGGELFSIATHPDIGLRLMAHEALQGTQA